MTANMTTMEKPDYWSMNDDSAWSSLILVETAGTKRPASVQPSENRMPWKTGSEIERADYEAARQLGMQRKRQPIVNSQTSQAKSGTAAGGNHTWLEEEPAKWRGRQVRNRKSREVFTVRQVFKSGRVELKKCFMLYLSNVEAVRADYNAA